MKIFIALCLVGFIAALPIQQRTVKIQDFRRVRRSLDDHHEVHVAIPLEKNTIQLRLKRNTNINTNMRIEFHDGQLAEGFLDGVHAYQDINTGAAVMVTEKLVDGKVKRSIEGKFESQGLEVSIAPKKGGDDDEHVLDVPSFSAKSEPSSFEIKELVQRFKRAVSKPHYHIEAVNVVDYTIWEYFLQSTITNSQNEAVSAIRYHYSQIMNGIDLVYRRINDPRFMMSLFVKKIIIVKEKQNCPFTDGPAPLNMAMHNGREVISASESLNQISLWMDNSANTGGADWMDWDHTFVWTKKDIYGSSHSTIGFAPVAGVCSRRGISINEDLGMDSWKTAAHELGHNLGSPHDGSGTQAACPATVQNVMTPTLTYYTISQIKNAFVLSQCSIDSIYNTLVGNGQNGFPRVCLMNKVCGHDAFNTNEVTADEQLPGVKYSLNEQCLLRFGNGAIANDAGCAHIEKADVCHRLVCRLGNSCNSEEPGAEDGSPCGSQKVCLKGRCVDSSQLNLYKKESHNSDCTSGTTLTRSVPSGCNDSPINVPVNYGTHTRTFTSCPEIIGEMPHLCFGQFDQTCCRECNSKGLISANNQATNSNSLCDPNPCKNNGVCRQYGSSDYVCECEVGFTGKNCNGDEAAVTAAPTAATTTTTTTTTTAAPTTTAALVDTNYLFNLKNSAGQIFDQVTCSQGAAKYGSAFCNMLRSYCLYSCRNL